MQQSSSYVLQLESRAASIVHLAISLSFQFRAKSAAMENNLVANNGHPPDVPGAGSAVVDGAFWMQKYRDTVVVVDRLVKEVARKEKTIAHLQKTSRKGPASDTGVRELLFAFVLISF